MSSSIDSADVWIQDSHTAASTSILWRNLYELEKELRCPICQDFFHHPVSLQAMAAATTTTTSGRDNHGSGIGGNSTDNNGKRSLPTTFARMMQNANKKQNCYSISNDTRYQNNDNDNNNIGSAETIAPQTLATAHNNNKNDNNNHTTSNNDPSTSSQSSSLLERRGICQHTFCSECIRKSLQEQLERAKSCRGVATCPICRLPVDHTGEYFRKCLQPNRSVEQMVRIFTALRQPLRQALCGGAQDGMIDSSPPPFTTAVPTATPDEHQLRLLPLERKRRPYYNGMKKKQLQELCQQEGLLTEGSERDLIQRYDEFLTLYNAEARDAIHPRPVQELVRIITDRERARQREERGGAGAGGATATYHRIERQRQKDMVETMFQLRNASSKHEAAQIATKMDREMQQTWNNNFQDMIRRMKEQKQQQQRRQQPEQQNLQQQNETAQQVQGREGNANRQHSSTNFLNVERNEEAWSLPGSGTKESFLNSDGVSKTVSMDVLPTNLLPIHPITTTTTWISDQENSPVSSFTLPGQRNNSDKDMAPTVTVDSSSYDSSKGIEEDKDLTRSLDGNRPSLHDTSTSILTKQILYPTIGTVRKPDDNPGWDYIQREHKKMKSNSHAPSIIGPWDCPYCTFRNEYFISSQAKCQMCEKPRQTPNTGLSSSVDLFNVE